VIDQTHLSEAASVNIHGATVADEGEVAAARASGPSGLERWRVL